METIEKTTLTQLLNNEDYARKVLPFIKESYFDVREERIIFEEISKFTEKYKKIPTQVSLEIEVGERKDLNETEHNKIVEIIKTLNPVEVDVFQSLMERIRRELLMQFQIFSRMPWVFLLMIVSVMIIFWIQTTGILTTIR